MNQNTVVRSPFYQLPISLVYKATRQRAYRNLHCLNCGMPIAQISDQIVMAYDGATSIENLRPDDMGIVDIRCDRHSCKQYYRLEFAL